VGLSPPPAPRPPPAAPRSLRVASRWDHNSDEGQRQALARSAASPPRPAVLTPAGRAPTIAA
jgi:hypothetical protein